MDVIISDISKSHKNAKNGIFSCFRGFFLVFVLIFYSNGRFFAIFL